MNPPSSNLSRSSSLSSLPSISTEINLNEIDLNNLSDLESVIYLDDINTDNFSDIRSVESFKKEMDMRDLSEFDIVFGMQSYKGANPNGNILLNRYFAYISKNESFIHGLREAYRKRTTKFFIENIGIYYAQKLGAKFYWCKDPFGHIEEYNGDKAKRLYERFRNATGIRVIPDLFIGHKST